MGSDTPQCQAASKHGQCTRHGHQLPDESYSEYCSMHGGKNKEYQQKKASLNNYRLTKWHAQIAQQAASPEIKNLRDEIAILRVILQEQLNLCDDAHALVLKSGTISDLVGKIEKVVTSCHKLEGSMGQLLDKQAVLQFANTVISLLSSELNGQEDILDRLANKIIQAISEVE